MLTEDAGDGTGSGNVSKATDDRSQKVATEDRSATIAPPASALSASTADASQPSRNDQAIHDPKPQPTATADDNAIAAVSSASQTPRSRAPKIAQVSEVQCLAGCASSERMVYRAPFVALTTREQIPVEKVALAAASAVRAALTENATGASCYAGCYAPSPTSSKVAILATEGRIPPQSAALPQFMTGRW